MFSVFIIAEESERIKDLRSGLTQRGFTCSIAPDGENLIKQVAEPAPDLVLVEIGGHSAASRRELPQRIKRDRHLPIIALIDKESLDSLDGNPHIDDFALTPYDATELALRLKRLLQRTNNRDSSQLIKCGDLAIDLLKYEVSVADKLIVLTFREYELLRFLASNRGHVFTREALLNKVWGYDYYGGDRTVDVHIRRLRSKIEDSTHAFIETVRNIGYRFRKDA